MPSQGCGVCLQFSLFLKQILKLARRHPGVLVAVQQRDQVRQLLTDLLLGFDDRAIGLGRLADFDRIGPVEVVERHVTSFWVIARLAGAIVAPTRFTRLWLIDRVGLTRCGFIGSTPFTLAPLNLFKRLIRGSAGIVQQITDLLE